MILTPVTPRLCPLRLRMPRLSTRFGKVNVAQRLAQIAQAVFFAHGFGDRVIDLRRQQLERLLHGCRDGFAGQTGGAAVDRVDTGALADGRKGRRDHLHTVIIDRYFSKEEIFSAVSQHTADIAVIEPNQLERAGIVVDGRARQHHTALYQRVAHRRAELGANAVGAALHQIFYFFNGRPVLIGARIKIQQLSHRANAQLFKLLRTLFSEALQLGDRHFVQRHGFLIRNS